uniref:Coproporphyrinogen III oxidase n=1 Tax=Micromonospora echinospora TaxID=1877 RepID=A0A2C9DJP9_MICEC|nr:Protoporphyrinogen oxidase [Micromonospora echinospora]
MVDNQPERADGVPHVVIVGGGVAGLTAAFYLREASVRITLLEASSRLGGKLAASEVAGVTVDEGAEGLYARRPKTTRLLTAAGLGDQLVLAGATATAIWTRGALRSLPAGQFMGVPSDMDALARSGIVSAEGVARARRDVDLPPTERNGDVSVAAYVSERLGREVLDRLVDPFLSDVCAGRSDELSFEAMLAPLANASRKHPSLTRAAASLIPPPPPDGQEPPTGIGTLTGSLGNLATVLATAVRADSTAATLRTGAEVTALSPGEHGWRLTVSSAAGTEHLTADAVIVAAPAGPAGRLLAGVPGVAPAAAELAEIPYASVGIVTLAYPRGAFPGGLAARGFCGYRVPAVDGRAVNEVTFSTVKWPHLAGEVEILRCSIGRVGDETLLQRDDADLASLAAAEVAEATGAVGAPVATRVTRWESALPQYTVGHLDRTARLRAALAAHRGLAVCGAAYDGVGVGTCIADARKAVDQVLAALPRTAATAASS